MEVISNNQESTMDLNGFIIEKNYIPEELLSEILCHVECKQLVTCHLVCKNWNKLIKEHVWQRKAELCNGQVLPKDNNIPWAAYYFICDKMPFKRNLLLSDNVEVVADDDFKTVEVDVNITHPIVNIVPFPDDLIFNGKVKCVFIPNHPYKIFRRKLIIDLAKEGLPEYLLDNLQPIIKITEWYCCNRDIEGARYQCSIKLLNEPEDSDSNKIMRLFHFDKELKGSEKRGQWLKFTHIFKNYGKGLRKIKFYDGGENGVITAGASVEVILPCTYNTKKDI